MRFSFEVTKARLRVLSALCSNLAAGWLFIIFTTRGVIPLTTDAMFVIFFWRMAEKIEMILEEL